LIDSSPSYQALGFVFYSLIRVDGYLPVGGMAKLLGVLAAVAPFGGVVWTFACRVKESVLALHARRIPQQIISYSYVGLLDAACRVNPEAAVQRSA